MDRISLSTTPTFHYVDLRNGPDGHNEGEYTSREVANISILTCRNAARDGISSVVKDRANAAHVDGELSMPEPSLAAPAGETGYT